VLRERERHIALLEAELATKNQWLEKALGEHRNLMALFAEQKADLERSNQWAEKQNQEIQGNRRRIAELQEEIAREQAAAKQTASEYELKIADLERDICEKAQWARDLETRLTAEVARQTAELGKAVDALHHTEKELEERTAWALRLQKETDALTQQLALVRASRWVKLGRKVGVGPVLPQI
jgi:chromosome segregation ATPase